MGLEVPLERNQMRSSPILDGHSYQNGESTDVVFFTKGSSFIFFSCKVKIFVYRCSFFFLHEQILSKF